MSQAARKSVAGRNPSAAARETKGWFGANRFLLLRRASQLGFLGLFLIGPVSLWLARNGYLDQPWWPVKGNLASSVTLDTLPLTDPYMLLQGLLAGHLPETAALLGALIVVLFYGLIGGRMYCSWFCPINPVTDAAGWLRSKLKIKTSPTPPESLRRWLLLATLVVSLVTGTIAWEWVNPISLLHRALIFGAGAAWGVIAAVFLYDLLFAARGWCGHVCPVGAFYGLLGKFALLRVAAPRRRACDDCMDCFKVCPEPQVIRPALKAVGQDHSLILSSDCTTCGRCVDVCSQDVFRLTTRFNRSES
jgi:ferredoxin-type protein NapH